MRRLNAEVDEDGRSPAAVAARFIETLDTGAASPSR